MRNIREEIYRSLEEARLVLSQYESALAQVQENVVAARESVSRLSAALDAMDGKQNLVSVIAPAITQLKSSQDEVKALFDAGGPPTVLPLKPNIVTVNGEEVILEPGFKVMKNAFGEESIVPENTPEFAPMAEPVKTLGPINIPGVGAPPTTRTHSDFEDPRDLL